jgi:hypothetical protein
MSRAVPVMLGVMAAAVPATAEECLDLVGRWSQGPPKAVAVAEGTLFYATGSDLVAVDVTDPMISPTLSSLAVDGARSISVGGGFAYLLTSGPRLRVIDVSNPSQLYEAGSLELPGASGPVLVGDGFAVVDQGRPCILDLADPTTPRSVACLEGYHGPFTTFNGLLVAFDSRNVVTVMNVDELASASVVGTVELVRGHEDNGLRVDHMTAMGDQVFVQWHDSATSHLSVIDATDPAAPAVAGSYRFPSGFTCSCMVTDGERLFLARDRVEVIDVSDAAGPAMIGGTAEAADDYRRLAIGGNRLYAVHGSNGDIDIFDIAEGSLPVPERSLDLSGPVQHLAVSGSGAYAADCRQIRRLDLSEPTAPRETGRWSSDHLIRTYSVFGDLVYLFVITEHGDDLVILNVADQLGPWVENVLPDFPAREMTISGRVGYGARGSTLLVFDLTDPVRPTVLTSLEFSDHARVLGIDRRRLYVATRGRFHVVDVSYPEAPVVLGSVAVARTCCSAAASNGDVVYLLGLSRLYAVDVSVATAPRILGVSENFCLKALCRGIRVLSNDLLLVDRGGLLMLHDISNPGRVRAVAAGPFATGFHVRGNYVYAPQADRGVEVYSLAACRQAFDRRQRRPPAPRLGHPDAP